MTYKYVGNPASIFFSIFAKLLKLRTSKIDVQLEKSIVNAAKVTKSSSF